MRLRALRRIRPMLALLAILAPAGVALLCAPGAAAIAFTETTPVSYAGVNSCTGEAFAGTGTMHFLDNETVSASGFEYDLAVRLDGLQAMTTTGKKYVAQDVIDNHIVSAGADEATFDVVAHYIRVGEDGSFILGDDFYEYLRTHIAANANGQVTAFTVNTNDMPCQ
jgi:hypothetical protein